MFWNKKSCLSLLAGLLLSLFALYFTFKNIPLGELVDYLKRVNYWWAIPSMSLAIMSFAIRVVRWQLLLAPVRRTAFPSAYHATMIGFMANCLLPARLGELVRPAVLSKRENVSFTKVLATVGVERALDVIILIVSFVIVFATVEISSSLHLTFAGYHLDKATLQMSGMTTLKLLIGLVLAIALVSFRKTRTAMTRVVLNLPNLLFFFSPSLRQVMRERLCTPVVRIIDNLAAGFELLKSPKKLGLCLVLSVLVWAAAGASHYVMAFGCPGIQLSFFQMYAVMVILCFFISLPSAPGFWGLWEAGGVFGLLIFGIPAGEAAGFTLANHVFQMVPAIVLGLVSLTIIGMTMVRTAVEVEVEGGCLQENPGTKAPYTNETDEACREYLKDG
ncbi:MAG: lysylphosphatidylglycerol synthase transmembrane domain-containing protein [Thermodesulfobacteriota bacterium]|nr:lysylphosphatidylglycerol synthase transmembrane domain-containing protein [Thermodesulfobacteriota bacterium]